MFFQDILLKTTNVKFKVTPKKNQNTGTDLFLGQKECLWFHIVAISAVFVIKLKESSGLLVNMPANSPSLYSVHESSLSEVDQGSYLRPI